ncbi:MAG: (Fe-S)-binding protein, partial [Calditrichaeota bacterium]
AEHTRAEVVCTACPYCSIMIDDGIKETGREEKLTTVDVAQLVVQAMDTSGK